MHEEVERCRHAGRRQRLFCAFAAPAAPGALMALMTAHLAGCVLWILAER